MRVDSAGHAIHDVHNDGPTHRRAWVRRRRHLVCAVAWRGPRVFTFAPQRALLGRFRWEVKGTVDAIYRNIIDCIYLTNITLHPLLTARCPYSSSFDGAAKEKGGFPWVESARSSFRSGKVAADTPCCTR